MNQHTKSRIVLGRPIPKEVRCEAIVDAAIASVEFEMDAPRFQSIAVERVQALHGAGTLLYDLKWPMHDDVQTIMPKIDAIVESELRLAVPKDTEEGVSTVQRITLHSELLGSGAYSDVWAGTDILGREVAVKFLRPTMVSVQGAIKPGPFDHL